MLRNIYTFPGGFLALCFVDARVRASIVIKIICEFILEGGVEWSEAGERAKKSRLRASNIYVKHNHEFITIKFSHGNPRVRGSQPFHFANISHINKHGERRGMNVAKAFSSGC